MLSKLLMIAVIVIYDHQNLLRNNEVNCINLDDIIEKEGSKYNTFLVSGVLVDLHSEGCRQLNLDTVQQVMAAKWAVEVINNQSLPHELNIGEKIMVIIIRILMMA